MDISGHTPPSAAVVWCRLRPPRRRDLALLASAEPFPDLPCFAAALRLLPAVRLRLRPQGVR